MDKKVYLSILAALATAVTVWLLALLAAPIALPLAWALIIGVATLPHHDRLVRRFPRHPNRTAGLMVLAITVCFVLPVVAITFSIAHNAPDWFREGQELIQRFGRQGAAAFTRLPLVDRLARLAEGAGLDLAGYAGKAATAASGFLIQAATNTAKGLAEFLFTLAVALFLLFFIYRDGKRALYQALDRYAGGHPGVRRFLSDLRATITAVTVGTIYTCIAQGITAGLGYVVAGVPAPVLWGALTAVAALIPVVGTALVWIPLTALIAVRGEYLTAGLLAGWCLLFVGLADNAIRPLAVGAERDIPVMPIVLGAICGVTTLGVLGLIVGPVIFASLITVWQQAVASEPPPGPDAGE